jgi:hypothetical protein
VRMKLIAKVPATKMTPAKVTMFEGVLEIRV